MDIGRPESNSNSKAVFFDLDGTLVDHDRAEERGARVFFEMHHLILKSSTFKEFWTEWREASERHMEQFLRGGISFPEQRRRRIREVALQPVTPDEADRLFSDYVEAYEAEWTIFEDVLEVLAALETRGFRMGVISNGDADQQRAKLARMDLARFFDHVLVSGDTGFGKPGRSIFETAAARMGRAVEDCVHIGDSFENDIVGAASAGMKAVWINRAGYEPRNLEAATFCPVRDLREILDFAWLT